MRSFSFVFVATALAWGFQSTTVSAQTSETIGSHSGSVYDLCFTPDGDDLVSAGADHAIHFLPLVPSDANRKERRRRLRLLAALDDDRFEVRQRAYQELAELGDSVRAELDEVIRASTSREADARARWLLALADSPRGAGHREEVRRISVSADGQYVASASRDNLIGLWKITSGRPVSVIKAHSDGVWCVDFSHDTMKLASGGGDHLVRIWDVKELIAVEEFRGHESTIHDVAFSRDGRILASAGGFDRSVRVWSTESSDCLHVFDEHADAVICLAIAPDGNTIISGDYDGRIYVWNTSEGQLERSFSAHDGVVRDLAFLPGESSRFISVGDDGIAKSWSATAGRQLQVHARVHGGLCSVAISPDGQFLVTGGRDGQIRRWPLHVAAD